MNNASDRKIIYLILVTAFFFTACANPARYYLPPDENIRNNLSTIYVDVLPYTYLYLEKIPEPIKSKSNGMLTGAAQGAVAPVAMLHDGDPICTDMWLYNTCGGLIVGLLLAPVGALVGGVYGLTATQSEEVVDEAVSAFEKSVKNYQFKEMLHKEFQKHAESNTNHIIFETYDANEHQNDEMILELKITQFTWETIGHIDPDLSLTAQIQVRMHEGEDRTKHLYTREWLYKSNENNFYDLTANKSEKLEHEMNEALSILSNQIVMDLFINDNPEKAKLPEPGKVNTVFSSIHVTK